MYDSWKTGFSPERLRKNWVRIPFDPQKITCGFAYYFEVGTNGSKCKNHSTRIQFRSGKGVIFNFVNLAIMVMRTVEARFRLDRYQ